MEIKVLKIYTANLEAQTSFYTKTLGLKIVDKRRDEVTVAIGKSHLVFIRKPHVTPYHFAINIPSNKIEEALEWLKERTDILKNNTQEIQLFENWNAYAIYFHDADHNIVEFIARKNLNNDIAKPFNENALLEISEIGVPVNSIANIHRALNKIVPLDIYDGGYERFCAIGNESGLFICINKNNKTWFPTGETAYASPFEIVFEVNTDIYKLAFKNESVYRLS